MSVRVASDPSAFNLRQVVTEETASRPFFLAGAPGVAAAAPMGGFFSSAPATVAAKPRSGLKFDFTSLNQADKPPASPVQQAVANIPDLKSTQFRNPFEQSRDSGNKADIMRMTAMVDDLQTRLKKASDRAQAAETQLTKTHQCLVAERQNAASRAKAVNAELGNAQATEASLRAELARATKVATQSVSSEKFEAAVAATLQADATTDKTRRELGALKKEQVDSHKKMELMAQELIDMHSKNSAISANASKFEQQYSSAVTECQSAKAQRSDIAAKLERAQTELADALLRAGNAESQLVSLQSTHEATLAQLKLSQDTGCGMVVNEAKLLRAYLMEQKDSPPASNEKQGEEKKEEEKKEKADANFDANSEADAPVTPPPADAAPAEAKVDARAAAPRRSAPSERVRKGPAVVRSGLPDPIEMYTKYHALRKRLSRVQEQIDGSKAEYIPSLIEVRDGLFAEARILKARYDTIFGTVDGAHAKSEAEKENAPQVAAAVEEQVEEEQEQAPISSPRFQIFGDEPPAYRVPFGATMAHKMSIRCPLGGAAPEGHRDIAVDIGAYPVRPFSISAEAAETDEDQSPESTGEHDSAGDMVNAVIEDLTHFLKDVQAKSIMQAQTAV